MNQSSLKMAQVVKTLLNVNNESSFENDAIPGRSISVHSLFRPLFTILYLKHLQQCFPREKRESLFLLTLKTTNGISAVQFS